MKRFMIIALAVAALSLTPMAHADPLAYDGFEDSWTGDYADNWDDITYRHGDASKAVMEQVSSVDLGGGHVITPKAGNHFLALSVTAAGDPEGSTDWWGGVKRTDLLTAALHKSYEPSASVWFYDAGTALPAPQLSVVPGTDDPDDWTDIQFGQRWNQEENYWYFEAAADGGYTWTDTEVARTVGWHKLEISLSSDGQVSFYIDDALVGTGTGSYEYLTNPWLQTQFQDGEFAESTVYFDDYTVVPEPATMAVLGLGGLGVLIRRRRR